MFRRLLSLIVVLAGLWAVGLVWFLAELPAPHARIARDAHAVVVYTGAGGDRIPTAMKIVQDDPRLRLMISGVNPEITRAEIAALWPGAAAAFDCCVDLGKAARTTEENALEARAWAQDHEFQHLILVTSDYHMPRALLETRAALPGAKITPHAVASVYLDARGRPVSFAAWRLIAIEYTKFLAVRAKTLLI